MLFSNHYFWNMTKIKMEKYKNIICFGEVLWDMLPSGAKPGGAPLNVAIHLVKNGLHPILISKTGTDKMGDKLVGFLENSGLKTAAIQKDTELPTSEVLVHLDENKNATYEICEPVAWDNIIINSVIINSARNSDLIIYGSLAARNKTTRNTLFRILKESTATKLVDINLRVPYDNRDWVEELLHISDFVKLNDDELIKIAGWNNKKGSEEELVYWLSDYFNCHTVCVTRGAKGAVLFINNSFYAHPGFKVNAVDTVGAGDSFLAVLVASLSKHIQPEKTLERACATGAFVASQEGAVPNYSAHEIDKIIYFK